MQIIPISEAPAVVERKAPHYGKPHKMTVHRWTTRGSHGRVLKSLKVGGKKFTAVEWIEDFLEPSYDIGDAKAKRQASRAAKAKVQRRRNASRRLSRLGA